MPVDKRVKALAWILVILILVSPHIGLALEFCVANSELDQVPFFIGQVYLDVQHRPADGEGQKYWSAGLEERNAQVCRSRQPSVLGGCEWSNAAQIVVDILNTPESISKNGRLASNREFVIALYRLLLHRVPDDPGLKSHLSVLDSGGSRSAVVLSFISSDEYRKRFACHEGTREPVNQASPRGHADLGVNGHPLTQPAYSDSTGVSFDDQLAQVQNLGAKWYRIDAGTGVDFAKMDTLLKKAQAHGVQLLPVILPPIDRAHDNLSTVYQKSRDGAFRIVSHYKDSIHVWELSNEQDNQCLHAAGDPGWFRGSPDGDQPNDYNPQKYAIVAAMLRGLAEGVRAADPSAQRIIDFAGWLHTGFFQRLEDDHVPYDIVGVHWYQDMGEITCPGQSFPCPPRPQHFNVIQRVQAITRGKPIWVTETNYRPLPSNSVEANISRKQSYLPPTLERYQNLPAIYPFQVVMIYELLDEPYFQNVAEQQFGLFSVRRRADGGYSLGPAKPTYQSVQRLFKP